MKTIFTSKPIFISHAASDKAIADKVVDLLNTAMGIEVQSQVFCTSLEGLKIPPGKDFKQFIKEQIQQPKIVVLLISQNYVASQFCLAEVGASWAMSHRVIPILVPPMKYDDMKAVLTNVNALKIEDTNDWNEALVVFKEELGLDPNVNRWERKRNEHVEAIKLLLPQQPAPPIIPFAQFNEILEKLLAANEEIKDLESDVKRLKEINAKIKAAKDMTEVTAIELNSLPETQRFENLVQAATKHLGALPSVVGEAIYYNFRGETMPWPGFGGDDERGEMEEALQRAYLKEFTDGVKPRTDAPKVSKAIEALRGLQEFVEKCSGQFSSAYTDEHDEELLFSSRTFWETHLL